MGSAAKDQHLVCANCTVPFAEVEGYRYKSALLCANCYEPNVLPWRRRPEDRLVPIREEPPSAQTVQARRRSIWRFLWPTVDTAADATRAVRNGAIAALLAVGANANLFVIGKYGPTIAADPQYTHIASLVLGAIGLGQLNPQPTDYVNHVAMGLIGGLLFLVVAWRLWSRSLVASILGTLLYVAEGAVIIARSGGVGALFFAVVLVLFGSVRGTRALSQ